MRIDEILAGGGGGDCNGPLFSFEFFPPKTPDGERNLQDALARLAPMHPSFVSVTYGAGGTTRDRTAQVCEFLRREFGFTVMPHLTCVGHTAADLGGIADRIHAGGFRNIMALRGDPPKGETTFTPYHDGLRYGGDLVALLKVRHPDFCLGVGGYPEKHPEAATPEADPKPCTTPSTTRPTRPARPPRPRATPGPTKSAPKTSSPRSPVDSSISTSRSRRRTSWVRSVDSGACSDRVV